MFTFKPDLSMANTTNLPQCFVVFLDCILTGNKTIDGQFFLFILNLGHIVSPASNIQQAIGQHNV